MWKMYPIVIVGFVAIGVCLVACADSNDPRMNFAIANSIRDSLEKRGISCAGSEKSFADEYIPKELGGFGKLLPMRDVYVESKGWPLRPVLHAVGFDSSQISVVFEIACRNFEKSISEIVTSDSVGLFRGKAGMEFVHVGRINKRKLICSN